MDMRGVAGQKRTAGAISGCLAAMDFEIRHPFWIVQTRGDVALLVDDLLQVLELRLAAGALRIHIGDHAIAAMRDRKEKDESLFAGEAAYLVIRHARVDPDVGEREILFIFRAIEAEVQRVAHGTMRTIATDQVFGAA